VRKPRIRDCGWRLPIARGVIRAVGDRLVQIDVTIANLDVEPALRVGANPCLVMDRGALATEVG
jgi:hypothetical protein